MNESDMGNEIIPYWEHVDSVNEEFVACLYTAALTQLDYKLQLHLRSISSLEQSSMVL